MTGSLKMDSTVIQSLRRFDDASQDRRRTEGQPILDGANIINVGCERFHSLPEPPMSASMAAPPDPYEQGLAEGERRAAHLHASTISAMEQSLSVLQTHFSQSLTQIRQDQAQVLMDVLEAALPALVRQSFFKDARNMIEALESSKRDAAITVHCAPEDKEPLSQLFQSSSNPDQFQFGETSLPANDMRFEWADGGADIDYRRAAAAAMRSLISQYDSQIDITPPIDSQTRDVQIGDTPPLTETESHNYEH